MIAPELLEILACPVCKKPITLQADGESVKCGECNRVYRTRDGILNMLADEAVIES